MNSLTLSDDEADTLLACLDFCLMRVESRMGLSQPSTEMFALLLTHQKVGKLRAKIFPTKEQK